MHFWQTSYDPKTRGLHHSVTRGFGHSLLAPLVTRVFNVLRVPAAVHEHDDNWVLIHSEPNSLQLFEIEHGIDQGRYAYNDHHLAQVRKRMKIVRGAHHGYCDLFAPIVAGRKVVATLVTGPFGTAAPTGSEILGRWRTLTGRKGHLADTEFAAYLSASLSILVLDGRKANLFEQLIGCVAQLMAGEGHADRLANRVEALRAELEQARFAERTWETVRDVVDERFQRVSQHGRLNDLRDLGLPREADHLLVGLTVSRAAELDPVEEAVRRHAFQRRAVDLARAEGDAIAGQVADHGVVFLSGAGGSNSRKRRRLVDLSDRAALAGRRFGLTLHFGASPIVRTVPLALAYQAALGAAESALASGAKLVMVDPATKRSPQSLRHLRQELSKVGEDRSALLTARFDRYLESVAMHCRYRVDPARGHLEAGFERMAEPLVARGTLDERSFRALCETLDRASEGARTIGELLAVYRRAALDLSEALKKPVQARRNRNLRGALDYMHRHYRERLSREKVARVAGFAPSYFSVLFSEREKTTFERYLLRLRIEQAKQLLEDTRLPAARVAELSGFKSPQYFCTAFRQATDMTPTEYRRDPKKAPSRATKKN